MLFDLPHLSVLTLVGPETCTFLQGQLTTDVREVSPTRIQPAALCNLQGRIMSLMDVCLWQSTLSLILPQNLLEKVTRVLAKPAQFSRIQLIQNEALCVMGYWQQGEHTLPFPCPETPFTCISTPEYIIYCLKPHVYHILMTTAYAKTLRSTLTLEKNNRLWHQARLTQGSVEIYPTTSEQFLPHRLNLHETPCISFNKGCYRGQEIIARTQYRATLKHRLAQYQVVSETRLEPGLTIYNTDNTPLGELIDVCDIGEHHYVIAASLLINHPMTVRFGTNASTLNLCHLP